MTFCKAAIFPGFPLAGFFFFFSSHDTRARLLYSVKGKKPFLPDLETRYHLCFLFVCLIVAHVFFFMQRSHFCKGSLFSYHVIHSSLLYLVVPLYFEASSSVHVINLLSLSG